MIEVLKVYTSTIRYRGENRLDISVKSGVATFAPSWDIVMGIKNKTITKDKYTEKYLNMMRKSYREHPEEWAALLERDTVVLCCYCPAGDFCHRYILKNILVKLGAIYMGEI